MSPRKVERLNVGIVPEASPGLRSQFEVMGPWITRWDLPLPEDGTVGGSYDAVRDPRVLDTLLRFAPLGNVLELGCLEGGHTQALAPQATSVLAVDVRPTNLRRARFAADALLPREVAERIDFRVGNVESDVEDIAWRGRFDTVVCLGVLYHLADPLAALRRMTEWGPRIALWTHVGEKGYVRPEAGWDDPLSGLHEASPWPTEAEVVEVLEASYTEVEVQRRGAGPPAVPEEAIMAWAWRRS